MTLGLLQRPCDVIADIADRPGPNFGDGLVCQRATSLDALGGLLAKLLLGLSEGRRRQPCEFLRGGDCARQQRVALHDLVDPAAVQSCARIVGRAAERELREMVRRYGEADDLEG